MKPKTDDKVNSLKKFLQKCHDRAYRTQASVGYNIVTIHRISENFLMDLLKCGHRHFKTLKKIGHHIRFRAIAR